MLRSVTGFGSASCSEGGLTVVEVRSVNNRHRKCLVRLPEEFLPLEGPLERTVVEHFQRDPSPCRSRSRNRRKPSRPDHEQNNATSVAF